ncbi:MAG: helix-turn-helix domain-containing protein [Actinomycetota bacterium]|nr:helix-turn-helix domain-containing protein [Actinomycetota bacterium]
MSVLAAAPGRVLVAMTSDDAVPGPVLGGLIEALGAHLVKVLAAPHGLAVSVGEPVVHDPLGLPTVGADDVVLAVGVDPNARSSVDFVARCAELGAAAVVVKAHAGVPAALVDAADAAGVALLVVPSDAAWGQLHGLLRTARSASAQRAPTETGVPLGDLFALADAVAGLVGGAVTVEDEHSVVLAYSSTDQPIDQARRDTILGRRVPASWLARLHDAGVFRRLWGSDEIVRLGPPEFTDINPRIAVAVRAGGEVLGSLWVAEGSRPLGPEAERALKEAARMAALHLLRQRSMEDLDRRRDGEQLRAVLEGRLPAALLSEVLSVGAGEGLALAAFDLASGADGETALAVDRAVDVVTLTCQAYRRPVVGVAIGRVAYAVLGGRAVTSGVELRALVGDLTRRIETALRTPVRAVVAEVPGGLAGLGAGRDEADLGLRVLAQRGEAGVAHVEDVRAGIILLQLRAAAAQQPSLVSGKVRVLEASDLARQTAYVATLRAFLDAFGDVRLAADVVGVHPNTFRYRLRKLVELADLDLDDPVERLVTQLQLHLLQL